jgi:hypothetical protein
MVPVGDGRMCRHVAHFYEDHYPAEPVADFFLAGLQAGDRCVAVLTRPNRLAVEHSLRQRGVDLESADYRAIATEEAWAQMQFEGRLDLVRAEALLKSLMGATADGRHQNVRAVGDVAPTLFEAGRTQEAVAFEDLVHRVTQVNGAYTLCAYPLPSPANDGNLQALLRLGAEHAELVFPQRLWVQRCVPAAAQGLHT